MTTQSDYWYALATKIIRTEMTKRNLTYEELVKNLREIGVEINVGNLRARISQGAFSSALFIQCLRAMRVKNLLLEENYFE
jgi:predicted DNA-binding ribbon-helix-helix protein